MVGLVAPKFDRFQTIRNKCQHCCGSMQTDATCWEQQCCVLLANNVASVCMGLKVWPVSNCSQQVPTLLWFHANGRNMLRTTMLRVVGQQCCVLLANNVASVCMGLKVWPVSNCTQQMQVPTSANIVVIPCKRTQHVGPNNVACCWPIILRPFAWAFEQLGREGQRERYTIICLITEYNHLTWECKHLAS